MRTVISSETMNHDIVEKVSEISGQDLLECYQCGKCSAGCPMVAEMDILPNQVIRLAQLGQTEDLLNCQAIWVCASCLTCNVRCPKGIRIAEVMEALRLILLRRNVDRIVIPILSATERVELPPIALVSSFRKNTA